MRGWWPEMPLESNLTPDIKPGDKSLFIHRLERLVQLELADLAVNAPYLNQNDYKKIIDKPTGDRRYGANAPCPNPYYKNITTHSKPGTSNAVKVMKWNRVKCKGCELLSHFIFQILSTSRLMQLFSL